MALGKADDRLMASNCLDYIRHNCQSLYCNAPYSKGFYFSRCSGMGTPMKIKFDDDADAAAEGFLTDTDRFVFLLEDVTSRLRRTFDCSVEQFGLTRTQWRTLAYLYRTPGMTQTELAKQLELERASIGQAIDRLEKMDLVERRSAENDRRVWQVHLLPAAIELLPALRKEADATYAGMLADLAANDLERFGYALSKMRDNLDVD